MIALSVYKELVEMVTGKIMRVPTSVARAWERIFQKMVGSEASPDRLYIYIYIQKKTCRMPN
jgi:hypothetical protein